MSRITSIWYYLKTPPFVSIPADKIIVKSLEVVKETPNVYYTSDVRFLKSDINVPVLKTNTSYPYIELNMVDADEQTLRKELCKWFTNKANEVNQTKIVRLDFTDTELSHYDEHFVETFYLVNPDEEKLNYLKEKVEHRFDGKGDENWEQFSAVCDYVAENFDVLHIENFEINW